ncbi:rubredoxin [Sedimenticola sp.]|uniref:rubredoxin n=1 Tax=Sedimenticola sp. TaxID=1940285 RepID=UPI003D0F83D9
MSEAFFAGSYGGCAEKLNDTSRLECKICWYLYDPAEGDPYWQIPPGTPFSRLPDDWSCPNCDGRKDDFMVMP